MPYPRPASCAGVIFDFEGTLVNFQWRLEPAEVELRAAFAALGSDAGELLGSNYATMWNAAALKHAAEGRMAELRQRICPIYDRWDLDALGRWAPRPGAAEVLRGLAAEGLRVGMVSNIGRAAIGVALRRFGFYDSLEPVVTRDDVTYMKPRDEGIRRVLSSWRVEPERVLFVGDSLADVLGARGAGLPVAIIRGGECAEIAFAGNPPDYMISCLGELAGAGAASAG